jgi:hypothetical protein
LRKVVLANGRRFAAHPQRLMRCGTALYLGAGGIVIYSWLSDAFASRSGDGRPVKVLECGQFIGPVPHQLDQAHMTEAIISCVVRLAAVINMIRESGATSARLG